MSLYSFITSTRTLEKPLTRNGAWLWFGKNTQLMYRFRQLNKVDCTDRALAEDHFHIQRDTHWRQRKKPDWLGCLSAARIQQSTADKLIMRI